MLRAKWLMPLLCLPAACAGVIDLGPTHSAAQAMADAACTKSATTQAAIIDSDVQGIRLSGVQSESSIAPYLFGSPAYAFVEWELEIARPDGTRLIRYAPIAATHRRNRTPACPDGAANLTAYVSSSVVQTARDRPRLASVTGSTALCATMQSLQAPTARWQIRRRLEQDRQGSFYRLMTIDEIIDARDDKVLGQTRKVKVEAAHTTRSIVFIGPLLMDAGKHYTAASCGRTLEAAEVLAVLTPPARQSP